MVFDEARQSRIIKNIYFVDRLISNGYKFVYKKDEMYLVKDEFTRNNAVINDMDIEFIKEFRDGKKIFDVYYVPIELFNIYYAHNYRFFEFSEPISLTLYKKKLRTRVENLIKYIQSYTIVFKL